MPWRSITSMDEMMRFVSLAQSDRFTITELCEQFNISGKTAYKHLERYAVNWATTGSACSRTTRRSERLRRSCRRSDGSTRGAALKAADLIVVQYVKQNHILASDPQDKPPAPVQPRFAEFAAMQPTKPKPGMSMRIGHQIGKGQDHTNDPFPQSWIQGLPSGGKTPGGVDRLVHQLLSPLAASAGVPPSFLRRPA